MLEDAVLIKEDIHEFLNRHEQKELLRFVTVGSVDDGKSTLIGRLLQDTDSVYEDQLAAIKKAKGAEGKGEEIDLAYITDGLKAEREQGITIDVAYRYFATDKRKFIIADTPGHEQYTRNMATGASTATVAIILIDARLGVLKQSKRHAYIASLLGIPRLLVAVNKMDLKDFNREIFDSIQTDFSKFAEPLGFEEVKYIPVSAKMGDQVVNPGENLTWFKGGTILEYLETVPIDERINYEELFIPVQYVLRPNLNFRGFSGPVVSGTLRKGQDISVLPSGKQSRVKSIVTFDGEIEEAVYPMAVTVTLEDEIDVSRGSVLVNPDNNIHVSRKVEAMLVWMGEKPLEVGRQYLIKHGANLLSGSVTVIHGVKDVHTLEESPGETLMLNDIGRVTVTLNRPIALDLYKNSRQGGAFIIVDLIDNLTVAAGMITEFGLDEARDSQIIAHGMTAQDRAERFGQKPAMVWFTGRPGTAKIVIARVLEKRLYDLGHLPFVMDPTRLPATDRHAQGEAIDRILDFGEVAMEMGCLALSTFTSGSKVDRDRARQKFEGRGYIEILCEAELDTRRARIEALGRDPRNAEIAYEDPETSDLVIQTDRMDIEKEVDKIIALLKVRGVI